MSLEDLVMESIRAGSLQGDIPEVREAQCAKIAPILKVMGHDDDL